MKILKLMAVLVLVMFLASPAFAEEVQRTAKVIDITGDAQIKPLEAGDWMAAEAGSILNVGDILKTASGCEVILNVNGNGETAIITVSENTKLMFTDLVMDTDDGTEKTLVELAVGQILIKAQKLHTPESQFEVKTPTSLVGVRGTEFAVKVEAVE